MELQQSLWKRVLTLLLAIITVTSMVPTSAFASTAASTNASEQSQAAGDEVDSADDALQLGDSTTSSSGEVNERDDAAMAADEAVQAASSEGEADTQAADDEAAVQVEDPLYSGGSGTEADPFLISTADDMRALATYVNGAGIDTSTNGSQGKFYKVTNDIDLGCTADNQWVPIGTYKYDGAQGTSFQGSFDGDYHQISGLYIDNDADYQALFGYVGQYSTVKNFTVEGYVSAESAAGVIGYSYFYPCEMQNLGNYAEVHGSLNAAGILVIGNGSWTGSRLLGCWNRGTISSSEGAAAGIVKQACNIVENCVNYGEVSGATNAGGIEGSTGVKANFVNCLNVGQVTSPSKSYGICGTAAKQTSTFDGCYYLASASAAGSAGGEGLTWFELVKPETAKALGSAFEYNAGTYPAFAEELRYLGEPTFDGEYSDVSYMLGDDVSDLVAAAKLPTVGAAKSGKLSYQWYRGSASDGSDAVALDGETYTQVTPDISAAGKAYYFCRATNTYTEDGVQKAKTADSPIVCVTVTDPATDAAQPQIKAQPRSQSIAYGDDIDEMTVAAAVASKGLGTLSYQWQKSADGEEWADIDGATSAGYTPGQLLGSTQYRCVVTNTFEGASRTATAVSDPATLSVSSDVTVSDAAGLRRVSDNVAAGLDYAGVTVKLAADISVGGLLAANWQPIGDAEHMFRGTFDGGYHKVSDMKVVSEDGYAGLFGAVDGTCATVENLLVSGSVESEGADTAAVVGAIVGGGDRVAVVNVSSDATVKSTAEGEANAGGIVGSAGASIEGCAFTGSVEARGGQAAGGIAGLLESGIAVSGCYSSAAVTAVSAAGGIAGNAGTGAIANSYSSGTVTAVSGTAGAISGTKTANIQNCLFLEGSSAYAAGGSEAAGAASQTDAQLKAAEAATALGSAFAQRDGGYPQLKWELYRQGAPVVTTQPQDAIVAVGADSPKLSVEAQVIATGDAASGTLSYQWQSSVDGSAWANVENATQATYSAPTAAAGVTYFRCEVSNAFGAAKLATASDAAMVAVTSDTAAAAPTIAAQPQDISINIGNTDEKLEVKAEVSGAGAGALSYQWYASADGIAEGGEPVEGATQAEFVPTGTVAGTECYYCVVTNTFEGVKTASTASSVATVTVNPTVVISTADELVAFASAVNSGTTYHGYTVVLANDIDLTSVGSAWQPIGTQTSSFYGTFDGGYHSVTFDSTAGGLFGAIRAGASVQNVIIKGKVSSAGTYVAGAVAYADATSSVGTIAKASCVIRNCGNEASVTCSGTSVAYIGGIVGYATGGFDAYGCYNTGSVSCGNSAANKTNVGGVAGYLNSQCFLHNCYNSGNITGYKCYAGGVSGSVYTSPGGTGKFENCYNSGTVTGEKYNNRYPGSLWGGYPSYSWITPVNCYALDTTAVASSYGNGATKTDTEMKSAEFAATMGSSFVAVDGSFPKLAWEDSSFAPQILVQPTGAGCSAGGEAPTLTVLASTPSKPSKGWDGTLGYQWYSNATASNAGGTLISGADKASYTPSVSASGVAYYYCVITNKLGDAQASTATNAVPVSVTDGSTAQVSITTQPAASGTFTQGDTVSLSVEGKLADQGVKGDLAYQWYVSSSQDGSDAAPVEDGASASIAVKASEIGDFWYFCKVSNRVNDVDFGTVTSSMAKVSVNPLTISTADELLDFAKAVNGGKSYEGCTVQLGQDIDLSSICGEGIGNWTSIGTSSKPFMGKFDGNGHSVTGIYFLGTSTSYVGLFGYVKNAELCNFKVGGYISASSYVGLAVGYTNGTCYLHDIETIEGSTVQAKYGYAAGIVGYFTGTALDRLGNNAKIVLTGGSSAAGICATGNSAVSIESCYNTGDIEAESRSYCGGILGEPPYNKEVSISNCYNTGDVNAGSYSAGIAGGSSDKVTISDCFMTGTMLASGVPISTAGSITNCYYTGKELSSFTGTHVSDAQVSNGYLLSKLGDAYMMGESSPVLTWQEELGGYASIAVDSPRVVVSQYAKPVSVEVKAELPSESLIGGNGTLSYQWYSCEADGSNATKIDGAIDASYKPDTFMESGVHYYCCEVTNSFKASDGSPRQTVAKSQVIEYCLVSSVDPAVPMFTSQPDSRYYELGVEEVQMLSAAVDETPDASMGELTYQWYEVGNTVGSEKIAIDGATDTTYTPDVSKAGTRYYLCEVTNTLDGVKTASNTSDVAKVVVWDRSQNLPVIDAQPSGESLYTQGDKATALAIDASLPQAFPGKTGELSYQWYRNTTGIADPATDVAVEGETGASCVPDTSLDPDVYYYYCVVSNTFDTLNNTVTTRTVSDCVKSALISSTKPAVPQITVQPAPHALEYTQGDEGDLLHAAAVVTGEGSGDISYQWYRNTTGTADPANDEAINGATGTTCEVDTSLASDTYWYYCLATNTFEKVQTSSTATDMVCVKLNPILTISDAAGMFAFAESVNAGTDYSGYTVELACDIDLGNASWIPIGTFSGSNVGNAFKGEFDGNGYTISGLNIDSNANDYAGLFSYISSATIHDFVVRGTITSTSNHRAGVVSCAHESTIYNVGNEVDIQAGSSKDNAGIVSKVQIYGTYEVGVTIDSCYNKGSIAGTNAGGIYGDTGVNKEYGNFKIFISNCYNAGTIEGTSVSSGIATGFCKNIAQSQVVGSVKNCFNVGTVGGSATASAITALGSQNADCTEDCFYLDGSAIGTTCGTAMAESQMKASAFATQLGDAFEAADSAYPVLAWENHRNPAPPVFTLQPQDITVAKGGDVPSFKVAASNADGASGTITYQWYVNDLATTAGATAIENAKSDTYTPSSAEAGTSYYFCRAFDASGKSYADSDVATLCVTTDAPASEPTFLSQPQSLTVDYASDAELTVAVQQGAEGVGDIAYQWYEAASSVADPSGDMAIDGATKFYYSPSTGAPGTRYYYCVATNTLEGTKTASAASDVAAVSVSDTIDISNVQEFVDFANAVNNDYDFDGVLVTLSADIDLSSVCGEGVGSWTPIGHMRSGYEYSTASPGTTAFSQRATVFRGTFEGNGHAIQNMYISAQKQYTLGLFGFIEDATLRDFTVSGYAYGHSRISGVAACTGGSCTIENVGSSVDVRCSNITSSGKQAPQCHAGIVAYAVGDIVIRGCYNKGSIDSYYQAYTSNGEYTGGILAYCSSSNDCRVISCYNAGYVRGYKFCGTIAAACAKIYSCYNVGTYDFNSSMTYNGIVSGDRSESRNSYYLYKKNAYKDYCGATQMAEEDMTTAKFAETLNSVGSVAFGGVDGEYPYLLWEKGASVSSDWTVDPIAGQAATGLPVEPAVVVRDKTGNVVDPSNYTVSYSNNVEAGMAQAMVCASGSNVGSVTASFAITGSVDVVKVNNLSDLEGLAEAVNSGISYEGKTIELMSDIDMSGSYGVDKASWMSIGAYSTSSFKGTFHGNGHTVSGLYIGKANGIRDYVDYSGLFGYAQDATFSDLVVEGSIDVDRNYSQYSSVDRRSAYVGGVCGTAVGCTFANVVNKANVKATSSSSGSVGGISGKGGSFVNCLNAGTISSAKFGAGGICGYEPESFEGCYNTGSVTGAGYAGGLSGYTTKAALGNNLSGCYNSGTVKNTSGTAYALVCATNIRGNDCYYLDTCGGSDSTGATKATANDLAGADVLGALSGYGFEANADGGSPVLTGADFFGAAVISSQPVDVSVAKGAEATLSVGAAAPAAPMKGAGGTLTYKWQKLGENGAWSDVDGAIESTYKPSTAEAGVASYRCVVTNAFDGQSLEHATGVAKVSVTAEAPAAVSIATQPVSGQTRQQMSDSAKLSVAASLVETGVRGYLAYQWYWSDSDPAAGSVAGTAIAGATSAECTASVETLGDGWYWCEVSNVIDGVAASSAKSSAAKVTTTAKTVSNADELKALADLVNAGNDCAGITVQLAADIDLSSIASWTPVGTSTKPFAGILDGQGHAITGLAITGTGSYQALIGYMDGGSVHDLTVAGTVSGKDYAAGIVGYAFDTTLQNLGSYVTVSATGNNVGDIVGYAEGGSIDSCFAKGNVTTTGNNYCGGIAGNASAKCDISYCYSTGKVVGKNYVGGIVGNGRGEVSNCYVLGTVTSSNSQYWKGSINGWINSSRVITNCYYVSTLGVDDTMATRCYDEDMKGEEFATQLDAGAGKFDAQASWYPTLAWENAVDVAGKCTVASIAAQTWTGDAIQPDVSVTLTAGGTALVKDKDYTVSYGENKDAGTGTVTIAGKGSYVGSKTVEFDITGTDIAGAVVEAVADQSYVGKALEPSLKVTLGGKELAVGTDYTVEYSNNVKVGEATANISGAASKGYTGTKDVKFKIVQGDLSKATIAPVAAQYYTGSPVCPAPSVSIGDVAIDPSAYDVSYSSNTLVGTATLAVTAKEGSGFAGSCKTTFEIQKTDISKACEFDAIADQVWTGSAIEPKVVARVGGTEISAENFKINYSDNVAVGTAIVTVEAKAGLSFEGAADIKFNIVAQPLDGAVATVAAATYTGSAVEPAVSVKTAAGTALVAGTDYDVAFANNTEAGTGTYTVTGKGNYSGTIEGTFEIAAAPLATCTVSPIESQTYTGAAIEPAVEVKLGETVLPAGDYTVAYSGNVHAGTATVMVSAGRSGNLSGSSTATFEIKPAAQTAPRGIARTDVSVETLSDGAIWNLTSAMEWKAEGADAWTPVAAGQTSAEGLAEGIYLVRFAADSDHVAGEATSVKIAACELANRVLELSDMQPEGGFADLVEGYSDGGVVEATLTNEGNLAETGISATLEGEGASAFAATVESGSLEPGASCKVSVSPVAGLKAGTYAATLRVATAANPEGDTMELSLVVEPVPNWSVAFDASEADLGTVRQGSAAEPAKLALESTGNQAVGWTAFMASGDSSAFAVSPASGSLEAGQSAELAVSAKDGLKAGTYSDVLVAVTSKGDYLRVPVTLVVESPAASFVRIAGDGRVDTAAQIVGEGFADGSCDKVIVATAQGFADALSASALAGAWNCPVVTTYGNELSPEAAAQITRVAAEGGAEAVIVGGESAVSASVADALASTDGVSKVTRIAGGSRYDTAAEVMRAGQGSWSKTCILASGSSYADALSISSYAYASKTPILLVSSDDALPGATAEAVAEGGFERVIAVGGTAVVRDAAVAQTGLESMRLAGSGRLQTSREIALWATGESLGAAFQPEVQLTFDGMAVATAWNYADALASTSLIGPSRSALLLVDSSEDSRQMVSELVGGHKSQIFSGWILGGTAAVGTDVEGWISEALKQ